MTRDRVSFVKDFWTVASYLFVSPANFGQFMIKAGSWLQQKPVDPNRKPDPRAKVYDDAKTAPFLAKDVDKIWNEETSGYVSGLVDYVKNYDKEWTPEALSAGIEGFVKEKGWPMGKAMNGLRLALTGAASGLGVAEIISIIGRGETERRFKYANLRLKDTI
jgi:glutamyl-tRNA synthetase